MVKIFNKISKLFLILDQLISFLKIFFFITSINKNSIIYINIIFNFINLYLSHNLKSLKFFEIYVKKPILIIKNLKNKNDFLHLKTHFIKKFIKIKKNKKKLNYIFKNKKIKIYNNIKSNIKI
jgi:single-stranded DNA-specific DHH superfamily exonuclease